MEYSLSAIVGTYKNMRARIINWPGNGKRKPLMTPSANNIMMINIILITNRVFIELIFSGSSPNLDN